jgi:hypothetical protein
LSEVFPAPHHLLAEKYLDGMRPQCCNLKQLPEVWKHRAKQAVMERLQHRHCIFLAKPEHSAETKHTYTAFNGAVSPITVAGDTPKKKMLSMPKL